MRHPRLVHGDHFYRARLPERPRTPSHREDFHLDVPHLRMACLLAPLCRLMRGKSLLLRGSVYTFCIFAGEFISGSLLKRHGACPWDYSRAKYNIKGVVRLDYAPLWFGAGLLFEKIIR